MSEAKDGTWDQIIKPKTGLLSIDLAELYNYKDLVWLFAKRDIATIYKQTVLGPIWFIIQPTITTIIYMFLFGNIANLGTDGVPSPLFYFSGTMLWSYFQISLTNVSDTFVQNASLFGKVYFPRITVPLSKLLSNLVALGIQLATLACIYVYYAINGAGIMPAWGLLLLPFLVVWLAALSSGIGMLVSALAKKYRDLRQLLHFGLSLWMYATPVVYPLSKIPSEHRWIITLNPVTVPIELFRSFAFGLPPPELRAIFISVMITVALFSIGVIVFHRNEATFVDVV